MEAVKPDRSLVHPRGAHRPIVEAVLAGDAEAAASAMREHAREVGEQFIKLVDVYGARAARGNRGEA